MRKKLICILLLITAICTTVPSAGAASYSYITDPARADGSDYTDIPALAQALDRIFSGTVAMYSDLKCTTLVRAPLGTRTVPVGTTYYAKENSSGKVFSGSSCYIYANGVYSYLFGDIPYHGWSSSWKNSRRVSGSMSLASYSSFASLGVRTGALLRTTGNKDGSYNGNLGHSIIILSYDNNAVTYLEGNGDGKGLIRIARRTWDNFNSVLLTNRGYKISFIVQPTDSHYESLGGTSSGGSGSGSTSSGDYVGYFSPDRTYTGHFNDVAKWHWYYPVVAAVYSIRLMDGTGGNVFSPNSSITVAEAVTLAARILSGYYDDRYSFTGSGTWYEPYYQYLTLWGIDPWAYGSPGEKITRGNFARLMARAIPSSELEPVRQVADGSIGDVPSSAAYCSSVYTLYRAGILTGSGGNFYPDKTLTRAEAAAVAARLADRGLRVK